MHTQNFIKHLLEGASVALAVGVIAGPRMKWCHIFSLGVSTALIMMILDSFASEVAAGSRSGIGFGLGLGGVSGVGGGKLKPIEQFSAQRGPLPDETVFPDNERVRNSCSRGRQLYDSVDPHGATDLALPHSVDVPGSEEYSRFHNLPLEHHRLSQATDYQRGFMGPACDTRCGYVKSEVSDANSCGSEVHLGPGDICEPMDDPVAKAYYSNDRMVDEEEMARIPKELYQYPNSSAAVVRENFASEVNIKNEVFAVPTDRDGCGFCTSLMPCERHAHDLNQVGARYSSHSPGGNHPSSTTEKDGFLNDVLADRAAIRSELPGNWGPHGKSSSVVIPQNRSGECSQGLPPSDIRVRRTLAPNPQDLVDGNAATDGDNCWWN